VLRIDAEMVLHDAAMTRMVQWWRRTVRTGYGLAESVARSGPTQPADLRRARSVLIWGLAFPALVVLGLALAARSSSSSAVLLVLAGAVAALLAQALRIAIKRRSPGENAADAAIYAAGCMAGKLPQLVGMLRYLEQRLRGRRARLQEYK
jgi:hypothetical protein